jgi:hypothetical protein
MLLRRFTSNIPIWWIGPLGGSDDVRPDQIAASDHLTRSISAIAAAGFRSLWPLMT